MKFYKHLYTLLFGKYKRLASGEKDADYKIDEKTGSITWSAPVDNVWPTLKQRWEELKRWNRKPLGPFQPPFIGQSVSVGYLSEFIGLPQSEEYEISPNPPAIPKEPIRADQVVKVMYHTDKNGKIIGL